MHIRIFSHDTARKPFTRREKMDGDGNVPPFSQHFSPERRSTVSTILAGFPGCLGRLRLGPTGAPQTGPALSRTLESWVLHTEIHVVVSQGWFSFHVGGCSAHRGVSLGRGVLQLRADFSPAKANIPSPLSEKSPSPSPHSIAPLVLSVGLTRGQVLTPVCVIQ